MFSRSLLMLVDDFLTEMNDQAGNATRLSFYWQAAGAKTVEAQAHQTRP
jgi:3-deoxy-D-arabino-heptulosonate 7-phosphate (DAHP) synthase